MMPMFIQAPTSYQDYKFTSITLHLPSLTSSSKSDKELHEMATGNLIHLNDLATTGVQYWNVVHMGELLSPSFQTKDKDMMRQLHEHSCRILLNPMQPCLAKNILSVPCENRLVIKHKIAFSSQLQNSGKKNSKLNLHIHVEIYINAMLDNEKEEMYEAYIARYIICTTNSKGIIYGTR